MKIMGFSKYQILMKQSAVLILLLLILVSISGCSTLDECSDLQVSHQKLVENYAALEAEFASLSTAYQKIEQDNNARKYEYDLKKDLRAAPWEDYAQKARVAYDKDDYPIAHAEFKNAIEAGCGDGIVWYRYAYSREQLFGLNQETAATYETAYGLLSVQHQDHRYTQYAKNKVAIIRQNAQQSDAASNSSSETQKPNIPTMSSSTSTRPSVVQQQPAASRGKANIAATKCQILREQFS